MKNSVSTAWRHTSIGCPHPSPVFRFFVFEKREKKSEIFLFFEFFNNTKKKKKRNKKKLEKKKNLSNSPESVAFIVALGTSVRSAARVNARITDHIGLTRPFQVYLGMYLNFFFLNVFFF